MFIPAVCYRGAGREHGSVMMNGSRNKEFEIDSTMNKRNYNKPEVTIVKIAYQAALLSGSPEPESDPSHSGGGARGASFSDFDIEE